MQHHGGAAGGHVQVQEDGVLQFGGSGPAAQLAVDILTSALSDDSMTQHWSRNSDAARQAFCNIYIRSTLSRSEPQLNFLTAGKEGAVVSCLLPDQKPGWLASTWQGLRLLLAAVPFTKWREFTAFDAYLSSRKHSLQQEHGAFIHIVAIGARPQAQGKGVGSQLLRRLLAHADKHSLGAYLEDLETWNDGFPLHLMWRPAGGGGGPVADPGAVPAASGAPAGKAAADAAAGSPAMAAAGGLPIQTGSAAGVGS